MISTTHSARARPQYLLKPPAGPTGLSGSNIVGSGLLEIKKACAGCGSRGGYSLRSLKGGAFRSTHSKENLKEWLTCAGVEGGLRVVIEDLLGDSGLAGELGELSIIFGPAPGLVLEGGVGDRLEKGFRLRSKVQRFLVGLGDLAGGFSGEVFGDVETLLRLSRDVYRSYADGWDTEEGKIPSNERKTPPGAATLSSRMIRSRRPGAGLQGAVDGSFHPFLSASL